MPTYQYACTGCDERIEVVQRFTDDPLVECAVCGGRLRKVFSPVGVVFKGSGFYRTDSRAAANGGGKGNGKGKGSGEGAPTDKDSTTSSESTSSESTSASGSTSGESTPASGPKSSGGSKKVAQQS